MVTDASPRIREQIVNATYDLMHEIGVGALTTKAIAERAGCAEGSIYRYFPDKHALIREIVHAHLGTFRDLITTLPDRAGSGSVRGNLEQVGLLALQFFRQVVPIVAVAISDPALKAQLRLHWDEHDTGPVRSINQLAEYIRREQRLGRAAKSVSADHTARLLLGAWFSRIMLENMTAELGTEDDVRHVKDLVRTLYEGLRPPDDLS